MSWPILSLLGNINAGESNENTKESFNENQYICKTKIVTILNRKLALTYQPLIWTQLLNQKSKAKYIVNVQHMSIISTWWYRWVCSVRFYKTTNFCHWCHQHRVLGFYSNHSSIVLVFDEFNHSSHVPRISWCIFRNKNDITK